MSNQAVPSTGRPSTSSPSADVTRVRRLPRLLAAAVVPLVAAGLVGCTGGGEPAPKVSYVTKVGDQICGVGYYK